MNKSEDLLLMAQQDAVYDIIKTFLKSDYAIKANIIGINVKIENGYVNAEWKFGLAIEPRTLGDIIQD